MRSQGFEQFLDANTLKRIQNEFGRFIEGDWARDFASSTSNPVQDWYPLADVSSGETEYTLQMDVPGVASEAIKVTVRQGVLTISGNRELALDARSERPSGKFCRQFNLPEGADENAINANCENGVLTVKVAITDISKGARSIPVNG